MKRILLALAIFGVWAAGNFATPVHAQNFNDGKDRLTQALYEEQAGRRTISINVRNKPLQELLGFIAGKAEVNILVDPEIKETVTIRLINVYWKNALQVIADRAGCQVEQISPNLFRVTKPPTVSMEFQDAELSAVLDLLARQAGSNIIIASNVGGKVTLNLRDVHWQQALDTIVKTSGYVAVKEEGNIIRVVRKDSLRDQLETEIIPLQYVRPPSTYKAAISQAGSSNAGGIFFVGKATAPGNPETSFTLFKALSGAVDTQIGEKVIYDPLSNSFVVRATKPTVNRLKRIIDKVDKEPLQVYIDVKFIRTTSDSLLARGLRFNLGGTGQEDGLVAKASFGSEAGGQISMADVPGAATGSTGVANPLPTTFRGLFPFELGDVDTFSKRFRVPGVLDFQDTLAILRMVKFSENSRIVQSPTLVTMNHHEATIFVGENVPFAEQNVTIDQNGTPTVTLEAGEGSPVAVGFTLFITPHVVPDTNKIQLTIIPKANLLTGSSSPVAGFERFSFTQGGTSGETFIDLPRTQEQVVVTNLMVTDRQTAVIAGLKSESKTEIVSKIPLLSSIPILGNLFTYRENQSALENLVILVTPTIMRSSEQMETVSRRKIIDFSKLDYFVAKSKGKARDGQFEEVPVIKGSYTGLINDLYKKEEEMMGRAERLYKEAMAKVEKFTSGKEPKYDKALQALEDYPYNLRLSTKYGKLISEKTKELRKAQKAYERKKMEEKKKQEEQE